MKTYDVIVIGGSAAGIPAAITAKRHYPNKSVLLIRKENKVLIPCGIPYIFGTVGTPEKNLIPDKVLEQNGIKLLIDPVVHIDNKNCVVETKAGEQVRYKKLVLATGSEPMIPPIPGIDKGNIFSIKKDVAYLNDMIHAMEHSSNLVIVGCGFIGVELAEECKKRNKNLNITIVEMMRHCLQLVYDKDFCLKAEETLIAQGVNLMVDEKVESFAGNDKVEGIKLKSGKEIRADMVILGIGAVSNVELARKTGLEIGPTRSVMVNRYMQTSDPNIFACGDCTEKVSFFDGKASTLKLASIATMEARIAGANLFASSRLNMGVIGVFSTTLGDSAFAAAGLTEGQAQKQGYNIIVGESETINRHPGGMPGAENLKVKLVFEAGTQIILGGQICGAKSGGELINAISAFVHQRMTANDIATFQMGTHPALTASPIAYQLVNAAEIAIKQLKMKRG
ncbi:MAG: FAD-dependent oxidoreductase [bacterium]